MPPRPGVTLLELRVASTSHGLIVIAIHCGDRCASGPLAIPAEALDTLRSALADVVGETGQTEEATDSDRTATRKPGSAGGTR